MGQLLGKLYGALWSKNMELVIIGLENSGKSTLVSQLCNGQAQNCGPTIGVDVKNVKKGGLDMKIWDLGGQAQYRQEWGKFLRGADAIIYVLDAANRESVGLAKRELHSTLDDPAVAGIPLLIIGNKTDIAGHMSEKEIIEGRIAINEKDLIWTIYSVTIGLWLWPVL
jgi:ADP-ribosylation factor-like protein 8